MLLLIKKRRWAYHKILCMQRIHIKKKTSAASWDRFSAGRRLLLASTSSWYLCWSWVGGFASAGLRTLTYSAEMNSSPVGKGKAAGTAWSISHPQSRRRRCSVPWDAPLIGAPYSSAKSHPRHLASPTAGQLALRLWISFTETRQGRRQGCNPEPGSAIRQSASWAIMVPLQTLKGSKE